MRRPNVKLILRLPMRCRVRYRVLFVAKGDIFAVPGISIGAAAIIQWYVNQSGEENLLEMLENS